MDIGALSIAMANDRFQTQLSTALLSKAMDTNEVAGENLIKMMKQSVQPNLGQHIDISL